MTEKTQVAGIPTTSKVLCAVYALIAVASMIATWSQNLAYADNSNFAMAFLNDLKANAAARSITVDIMLFTLSAAVLMVAEARKHHVRFVWVYILGSALTAISVTFPLFLIARELRIAKTDPTQLRSGDSIGLAIFGVVVAAVVIRVAEI
jgi:4-amino-4-deoxy-L-arabinose transferase-like glycosyltransferase